MTVMEVKKTQVSTTETPLNGSVKSGKKIRDFIGDIKAEVYKINWTSKEELVAYTKIVMATTFFMGIGLYVVDLFIQGFLNGIGSVIRLISG